MEEMKGMKETLNSASHQQQKTGPQKLSESLHIVGGWWQSQSNEGLRFPNSDQDSLLCPMLPVSITLIFACHQPTP